MKIPKQQYALELKQLAVIRTQGGESHELVANVLGMSSLTLRYWVRISNEGDLLGLTPKWWFQSKWSSHAYAQRTSVSSERLKPQNGDGELCARANVKYAWIN